MRTDAIDVAAIEDYEKRGQFDLILLATKAQDALEVAPHVLVLSRPAGTYCLYRTAGLRGCLLTVWAKTRSSEDSQTLASRWLNPVSASRRMPGIW